jgi:hypothetical protein
MSLAELLPAVRMLPREDQLELVRVLSADLASSGKQESDEDKLRRLFPPGATYEIYTPQFSPEAADELARFLFTRANEPK